MSPIAESDGIDAPRLIDELVPGVTAVVDDIVVGFEDAVRQVIFAQELPDIFGRIELRAFGRQRQERDICRNGEFVRRVPTSLIEKQHGMRARRNFFGDFGEMQIHRKSIAPGHDEGRALAFLG